MKEINGKRVCFSSVVFFFLSRKKKTLHFLISWPHYLCHAHFNGDVPQSRQFIPMTESPFVRAASTSSYHWFEMCLTALTQPLFPTILARKGFLISQFSNNLLGKGTLKLKRPVVWKANKRFGWGHIHSPLWDRPEPSSSAVAAVSLRCWCLHQTLELRNKKGISVDRRHCYRNNNHNNIIIANKRKKSDIRVQAANGKHDINTL